MDRRTYLKTFTLGTLGVAAACAPGSSDEKVPVAEGKALNYDRTPVEEVRDLAMLNKRFFDEFETQTLTLLCDIIIPAEGEVPSASKVGVPEFIDFMAQDKPEFQTRLRGGLKWLQLHTVKKFGADFTAITDEQRISVVDEIAYPEQAAPENSQGVEFFNTVRDLTVCGFYTSKEGLTDLGYVGNVPNVWDGVPEDVMAQYNLTLDKKYVSVYINQNEV